MTLGAAVKSKLGRGSAARQARGVGRLTLLVFGSMLAVLIFCAYHILPFYYCYFELQEQFHTLLTVANVHTDRELRDKIKAHMKRMEIPADVSDVQIVRGARKISMSLDYQELFFLRFRGKEYELHTFKFRVYAEREGA
jgi:hypothetical protein